jgi:CRISPR-associated endonuclease/helicase Cas3
LPKRSQNQRAKGSLQSAACTTRIRCAESQLPQPPDSLVIAYAHSLNAAGKRHDLVDHLTAVASLAARFAQDLGAEELGRYAGIWHDLGKFHPAFQEYLRSCEANPLARGHGPDHKGAGALLASRHFAGLSALLIQGHHGGLRAPADLKTWLAEKEKDAASRYALELATAAIPDLEPVSQLALPEHVLRDPRSAELFLRLVFSALVDADYLDTERHFRAEQAAERHGASRSVAELWDCLEGHQRRFSGEPSDAVSRARRDVYEACVAAAESPPGLFRLTVPTGGGKTLSGMAFALRHALRHGHQRVIVAVPFITITEQTADVYRSIFGADSVLEHHSAAGRGDLQSEDFHSQEVYARLAAENWDAPVIVTTTVQLFESLFANRTSACRKLHRLARSVIILDEAQALPTHLLGPILDALRELCAHYGATVVISTATQPAFEAIPEFAAIPATEIVPAPARFFQALKRVNYEWRTDPALAWPEVADMMRGGSQALAVVNTKKDAMALLDALNDSEALHLSTLLCGAHRRQVIAEVKQRLQADEPCRLVSTQVVEAGVDIDFPLVLRAMGPLDAIIQAAGRCNREGLLPAKGRVIVFRPAEGGMPMGAYRAGVGVTGALIGAGGVDPDDPDVSRKYFRRLFEIVDTDRERIQDLRAALDYPEVSRRFRMINDDTETVAITGYGSEDERLRVRRLLDRLRQGAPEARFIYRQLQPYLVSLRSREAEKYRRDGFIAEVAVGMGEWHGAYDPVRGLVARDLDPDDLVI